MHVVASDQRRGAEIFAADLVRALREHGASQRVAVLRSGWGGVDYGVPVKDLGATRALPGLRVDPKAMVLLGRAVLRPDVVQVHGGEALKYAAWATLGARTPIVYRRIGSAPGWITGGLRRRLYGALMRRPARIVAVAEAVRRETIALFGVAPGRVITIPNGVDPLRMRPSKDRTQVRRELGVPQGAPILLSVAALTWEKDPLTHLAVSSMVMDEVPGAMHLLAGDGPMRGEVEGEIRRRGLSGHVRALGARNDIADLMHASDVLLFASRGDGMEGMPAIVIEAGMAALVVVGYDVAGVAEIVDDGRTGFLTAWGDVEGLATRVSKLLSDDRLRRSMGELARKRSARLDVRALAPRYTEVYREVLGGR